MTSSIYQGFAVDQEGDIIPSATITVRDQDTNALIDPLWSNRATTSTKTNPFTADANGYFFFYRTAGRYKIEISDGVNTTTLNNVQAGTASEYDVGTSAGQIPTIDDLGDVATSNDYEDLDNLPALGSMALLDSGTGGSNFRTNDQNDGRFARLTNNLNDMDATSMRANLGISGVESLAGVVANNYIPLKRSNSFVDSPITVDANDSCAFTGNGPTSFEHDVDIDGHLRADTICAGIDVHEINLNGTTYTSDLASAESGGSNLAQVLFQRWNNASTSAVRTIIGRSRGTQSAPATVVDGDLLHEQWVLAYDGTNFRMGGRLRWQVDGTVSTGVIPTKLLVQLCDTGGTLQTPITIGPASVTITVPISATTIDTGQGAVECYAMDQAVRTTDAVTFGAISAAGEITANGVLSRSGPVGSTRGIQYKTSDSLRWQLFATSAAESGSNAGSDFSIARYDDSGNFISSWLTVNRATGATTISGNTSVTGAIAATTHIKCGSYTVATQPSAATAGEGARIHVTDGNAGAECAAISDGSNWKVVALGATTSAT